jgi:4-diphosphocytidyl-2-C-methyl-D-erythritol kinase
MIVHPNAKINIGLNITGLLPNGYHSIETFFYPVDIFDHLEVEPLPDATENQFFVKGLLIEGKPENNLIIKAWQLLRNEYNIAPVKITLEKNIPTGAGLGGGSSDAAFMLKKLNELFQLHIDRKKLKQLAAKLGADCAFFIDNQPVFAQGKGDEFQPVALSPKNLYLLVVKPDIHISTAEAYARTVPKKPETSLKEMIKKPIEEWKYFIKNDFEDSVFKHYPLIAEIKQKLYETGAVYVSMSGSGSAVYGIFYDKPVLNSYFNKFFFSIVPLT